MDDFKKINDTYGHNFGDEILKRLGKILRENIRKTDVAGRWGGDEFLIILPQTDLKNAKVVAEKLNSLIKEYFKNTYGKTINASIGISSLEKEDNINSLIDKADKALYKAKTLGKNKVIVYKFEDGSSGE